MEKLSLKERFLLAKKETTPAQALINEIIGVTHRKDSTVRQWLYGKKEPELVIKEILARHFETDIETLFPNS